MNSKERVKAAINKQPVDKLPLGLYVVDHDIIEKVIGRPTLVRNKPGQQIAVWEGRRDEMVESMRSDIKDFFQKLDCIDLIATKEARRVPPKGHIPENSPKKIDDKTWRDDLRKGYWKIEVDANDIMFIPDNSGDTLKEYTVEQFSDMSIPEPPDETEFELIDSIGEYFGKNRYILGSNPHVSLSLLGGIENGLMTLALKPEVVHAFNRQNVFRQNHLDKYTIRDCYDGLLIENDMAGTNGPLISPDMFREICFPYMKERISHMKQLRDQVILHNCGNNLPLMDQFVEAGIDGYQSIQTTSAMSIKSITEQYGDRLCIWGALPLEALIQLEPDDVRRAVRDCVEEAKDTKGFIFGPSHSIAYGTQYDNFMAMLDEFEKLR